MLHLETLTALRKARANWRQTNASVAFVPTMGNLHQGHLRLVEHARTLADKVVVSIYVNPLQFGANEDLDSYPRTLQADMEKLLAAGADAVFTPSTSVVYPRGLEEQTFVEVPNLSNELCGASRPGHFRGVATVVCKLFNMVQPDYAVFGKKDYQQLLVIRLLAEDLSLPITIIGVATERAEDGLALSSRNGYLNAAQRQQAAKIYAIMQTAKQSLQQCDQPFDQDSDSIKHIEQQSQQALKAAGFTPDYVSIRRQQDLAPATSGDKALVILVAAYLGKTRLIDNLEINLA
ncbi:pantoate--beta-alanine ligase [Aliidiomarina iranensis]|uniref:Pantothenate synthetase n=1 Tax=Aliidiomarina iranensis TaxID=1434071 RepID=A0A432VVF4_9GAMM|nr:pantoate--beta-alanine ligase [Aliidiomarina iranensis]RUO20368.1 pantoate--beta-alanine ligase [Aliidiomarina iranensis]